MRAFRRWHAGIIRFFFRNVAPGYHCVLVLRCGEITRLGEPGDEHLPSLYHRGNLKEKNLTIFFVLGLEFCVFFFVSCICACPCVSVVREVGFIYCVELSGPFLFFL